MPELFFIDQFHVDFNINNNCTYFIVSRKVLRSVISSGIRLKIRFKAADFLLSSWNASSVLFKRYSITVDFPVLIFVSMVDLSDEKMCKHKRGGKKEKKWLNVNENHRICDIVSSHRLTDYMQHHK